jgi:hypothetical protein
MTRVHVICEGQTEELFVAEVLAPALLNQGVYLIPALIGKPGHKGGNLKFERLQTDILARLEEKTAFCTTLFDFYGLPESFPGKAEASRQPDIGAKAACIRQAMYSRLAQKLTAPTLQRFLPYVQMYEFEGLLFSAPTQLASACNQIKLADKLHAVRAQFATPEDINNHPASAPSKRLTQMFPGYDKPLHGALAALEIGLPAIRRECRLFDQWVSALQALGKV